jgi:glycosyltransferase involved in cell wall biosynthesis
MIKFSVCTAFFNDSADNAKRLYECLLKQDADWEWVVTDDFSEDPSAKDYLKWLELQDPRVRYAEQSHKMEFMRNPAPFAKGEYVFHIDSDDLVYPGYLKACQRLFERFPEVGLILAAGMVEDQNKRFCYYQQHMLRGNMSFLGRCWRKSIEIDFSEILEERFFTMCNDFFIVKLLNTKTRMLILPRTYIQYRMFVEEGDQYKPFGERTEISQEMKDANSRSFSQFLSYYEPRKTPSDGLFPYYEAIESISSALYPLHLFSEKKMRFVGWKEPEWAMRLAEDLYFDYEISWGSEPEEGAINVIEYSSPALASGIGKALAYFPQGSESADRWRQEMPHGYFICQEGATWLLRI